jgi:hypothetical protein
MAAMVPHIGVSLWLLIALVAAGSSSALDSDREVLFFEPFDQGWEARWSHSRFKKYTGKFAWVPRPGSTPTDTAIRVSGGAVRGAARAAVRRGTAAAAAAARGPGPPAPAAPATRTRTPHAHTHALENASGGRRRPQVPEANRHYAMAAALPRPLRASDGLVVQYEVQITETHACGGAYVKLLAPPGGWAPDGVSRKTPYAAMFGPDRCGPDSRVGAGRGGRGR